MGTDTDYPSEGRYLPVSRGAHCVGVPRSTSPEDLQEVAQMMVHMMREHRQTFEAELEASRDKARMNNIPITDQYGRPIKDPDKGSRYHRIVDRVKEKMRRFNPTGTIGYTGALSNTPSDPS